MHQLIGTTLNMMAHTGTSCILAKTMQLYFILYTNATLTLLTSAVLDENWNHDF